MAERHGHTVGHVLVGLVQRVVDVGGGGALPATTPAEIEPEAETTLPVCQRFPQFSTGRPLPEMSFIWISAMTVFKYLRNLSEPASSSLVVVLV